MDGAELLDEHEDVVDVDLDLLDKFDLEHDVVVDRLFVGVCGSPELGVKVEVDAAVVLALAAREDLVASELIEGRQDVLQPEDRTVKGDEVLLCGLAEDRLAKWEPVEQLGDLVGIVAVVVPVGLQEHDTTGVLIAEQFERRVRLVLKVTEGDDVAVGLDRVQDAVGTRVRLDQTMRAKVLVHEQRVQRGRVEAREEHVDHNHKVEFPVLQSLREVLVVVLELVGAGVVTGAEDVVVVLDRILQEAARISRQRVGVEGLIIENAVIDGLVRAIRVDQADLEPAILRNLPLLGLEMVVVAPSRIDRGCREDGIEAAHPLALAHRLSLTAGARGRDYVRDHRVLVTGSTLGLLVEVLERVLHDLADALRRQQRLLRVNRRDLRIGDVADLDGVDVVNPKRQHVPVSDRIHDRVRVQSVAKGLLRGLQLRVAATASIDGEDRRAGEAEQVVLLERLRDRGMHVTKLGTVALVKDQHDVAAVDLVPLVPGDEVRQFLDGRDDDPRVRVFELLLQHGRRGVGVRGALLEPVVLPHGLVVEVLAIHDEQDLVDARQFRSELRGLERGQRLTRASRVPHIPASRFRAELSVVRGDVDSLQDPLGRNNLIRPHDQQLPVSGQHAVARQDVQQRVLGEERLRERGQVFDRLVLRIRPPRSELEGV